MDQGAINLKVYKVRLDGQEYYGPHLTTIIKHINEKIENPDLHLTQTCMSLCVRGKLKRGIHKGATGSVLQLSGGAFTVPEGGIWVPGYEAPTVKAVHSPTK